MFGRVKDRPGQGLKFQSRRLKKLDNLYLQFISVVSEYSDISYKRGLIVTFLSLLIEASNVQNTSIDPDAAINEILSHSNSQNRASRHISERSSSLIA